MPLQIVAEDAAASEVLEADEYDAATQDSNHYARETVTAAVDRAVAKVCARWGLHGGRRVKGKLPRVEGAGKAARASGVLCDVVQMASTSGHPALTLQVERERIFFKALPPEGGASGKHQALPALPCPGRRRLQQQATECCAIKQCLS